MLNAFVANEEQSLDETKAVVRKKLGLGHDTAVELAQVREGRRIDLEDGVCLVHSPSQISQFALDDDFEAFKFFTKTSLHATVAVTIPENGHSSSAPVVCNLIPRRLILLTVQRKNASVEGRRNPNSSLSEPSALDAARPQKKRKVTFNGDNDDLVTSAAPQPSQPLALKASHERPPTPVHKSNSEAVALPLSGSTVLHPASQAENLEADSAETLGKKRKRRDSAPLAKESSPGHGAPKDAGVVMPHDTQKKRIHKDQKAVSVMPPGTWLSAIVNIRHSQWVSPRSTSRGSREP